MERGTPWAVHPGVLLRAVRRARRLSQRELAANAQLPRSSIARIEAGQSMPRVDTFARLLAAANHCLMIVDDHGHELALDVEHERLIDRGARHYPAHLDAVPMRDGKPLWWWGWFRVAWDPKDETVPSHALVRRRRWFDPLPKADWGDPYFQADIT